MKKKYVLKNKPRFVLFISIITIIFFSILYTSSVYSFKESEYKVIVVKQGDTLWNIANENNKSGDIRQYIYDIKKLNKLESSLIIEGSELLIPVE